MAAAKKLTHVDSKGSARMVDVGAKPDTERRAVARGFVRMNAAARNALAENRLAKGDALAVARVAGIQAAKRTPDWIPLCHPIQLTHVRVEVVLDERARGVAIEAEAATRGPTGVEMEALTAVAGAALTLYDMAKSIDRSMTIEAIELISKDGGASGRYVREPRRRTRG